ncbi:hypothetical protein F4775DRAFT_450169 [Biscogniauxia sp. FL1348]|nr:hypothetical protein F4775DRAFT_450169 [Biscogniauxia sp. FL1348]
MEHVRGKKRKVIHFFHLVHFFLLSTFPSSFSVDFLIIPLHINTHTLSHTHTHLLTSRPTLHIRNKSHEPSLFFFFVFPRGYGGSQVNTWWSHLIRSLLHFFINLPPPLVEALLRPITFNASADIPSHTAINNHPLGQETRRGETRRCEALCTYPSSLSIVSLFLILILILSFSIYVCLLFLVSCLGISCLSTSVSQSRSLCLSLSLCLLSIQSVCLSVCISLCLRVCVLCACVWCASFCLCPVFYSRIQTHTYVHTYARIHIFSLLPLSPPPHLKK